MTRSRPVLQNPAALSEFHRASVSDQAAEALRESIAEAPVTTARGPLDITVSIGWAPLARPGMATLEEALLLADEGLYSAKRTGRNRIGPSPYLRQRHISATNKPEVG